MNSLTLLWIFCFLPAVVSSFLYSGLSLKVPTESRRMVVQLDESKNAENEISSMRLSEIQKELKTLGVSYSDCFDRESLTVRLQQARSKELTDVILTSSDTKKSGEVGRKDNNVKEGVKTESFDSVSILQELRSMKISELRAECAMRNIRWGGMFEKEDLVQALLQARKTALLFSPSILPGTVGELTDEELSQEIQSESPTPLLLDVYATWCGPCKLMAPELVQVAAEMGTKVRIAKIDSDRYPEWSRKLRVGAFPTILIFQGGREVKRLEGALMKRDLIALIEPYIVPQEA
jgi:thioredoxin